MYRLRRWQGGKDRREKPFPARDDARFRSPVALALGMRLRRIAG